MAFQWRCRGHQCGWPVVFSPHTRSAARRGRLLTPQAKGAAPKRQSRQDKQRRAAEWLKQAQRGQQRTAEGKGPAGALGWLSRQGELQAAAKEKCEDLEKIVAGGHLRTLMALDILDPEQLSTRLGIDLLVHKFGQLRWPDFERSIDQHLASPSSSLVPPSRESLFDRLETLAHELVIRFGGPAASELSDALPVLREVWEPVADRIFRAGFSSPFNSVGRSRDSCTAADVTNEVFRLTVGAMQHEVRKKLSEAEGLEYALEDAPVRNFDEAHAYYQRMEDLERRQQLEELQQRWERQKAEAAEERAKRAAETRPQREAARAQRRAERAIRDIEAQERQVREAEAARRAAPFRLGLLRRLQQAQEHRAAQEEVHAQERAERQQRTAVRQAKEYARKHDKLSEDQRQILEEEYRKAVEYNSARQTSVND